MNPGKCALYLALLMAALLVTASVIASCTARELSAASPGAHVRSAPPLVQDQFFCTADLLDSAALCASLRRNLPETRGVEALKRYGPCYLRLPNRNRSTPPTAAAAPRTRYHIV
jgi:hypothetical protein